MRLSHSSIPNFLQMFEEQSKERQKVREEMQATLDRWTAHNPFSPTVLLSEENKESTEDTHSSADGAGSVVEFHGSQDTLDNSLDGLDSTQDDSLSQVDSVLNRHRAGIADTSNLHNSNSSKINSVMETKNEETKSEEKRCEEKKREEVTVKEEVPSTPQASESHKEKPSINEGEMAHLSTAHGGISLEELRPGMNLEVHYCVRVYNYSYVCVCLLTNSTEINAFDAI